MRFPLVRILNTLARLSFWLHESNKARLLLWVMGVSGIVSLVFARPSQIENQTVRVYRLQDISPMQADIWVRVSGTLLPEKAYQTSFSLGALGELRGSTLLPLTNAESPDPLYVLAEDLPEFVAGQPTEIVGLVRLGQGDLPPVFIQPGLPPNVRLANAIARVGGWLLALSIIASALAWAAHFANYALPAPAGKPSSQPKTAMPPFFWFGSLGKEYGDAVVREAGCVLAASVHEIRFVSSTPQQAWQVCIHKVRSIQTMDIATRYGALPAAKLVFEDERGLIRHAVFAANVIANRDQAIEVMRLIR